jgi:hypothetical protein
VTSVVVECAVGTVEVDVDEDEVVDDFASPLPPTSPPSIELPLLVAVAAQGSTVIAVVDRRPPLVVSNDGGLTWRETGAGLGPGVDVAVSPDHPDLVVYATRERLHVSRDGGRFWTALTVELPEITSVGFAG